MPRGGFRENAGRKSFYGEKTIAVKIPVSRVEEVKAFLRRELNDLVTQTNSQSDLVTYSKVAAIQSIVSQWRDQCPTERHDKVRWINVNKLLSELEDTLLRKDEP